MNRKIAFRAKTVGPDDYLIYSYDILRRQDWVDNKWIYCAFMQAGYSCNKTPDTEDFLEVDVDTIQQFTGMTDLEGVDIYEGDLIELHPANLPIGFGVYEVFYNRGAFQLKEIKPNWILCHPSKYLHDYNICKVIGNIFENPELLK